MTISAKRLEAIRAEFNRPKSNEEIDTAINSNLDRYAGNLSKMLEHVNTIAILTQDRSGFFGIPFPVLRKRLQERING